MNAQALTIQARSWITGCAGAAHRAIDSGHAAGEQLAALADARWRSAMRQSAPQLTPQTRRNANQAKRALGRRYQSALRAASQGAHSAVDTAASVALAGTERAAQLAPRLIA